MDYVADDFLELVRRNESKDLGILYCWLILWMYQSEDTITPTFYSTAHPWLYDRTLFLRLLSFGWFLIQKVRNLSIEFHFLKTYRTV